MKVTVPGEIVLGGLFPIHEAGRNGSHCGKIKASADQGVQRMVAMLYALEKVNQDQTVLPQASLGAQILDTWWVVIFHKLSIPRIFANNFIVYFNIGCL
ncbi:unnamed protein product [Heligmosomoides polygyrus]|uniref:Uncharacterized protein n=1 Tax=Heligmosomoides polygyrus TaxID=6339 RepID=A0A183GQY4_HELPZ|nr:unnamed protein product [Heligmosomoides polygyrus]